jgi:predicted DNA-binding transcriptional regulator AlpA
MELLREVHALAFREIESLNLRVVELEQDANRRANATRREVSSGNALPKRQTPAPEDLPARFLNEHEVARLCSMSVASVRRWRLFRKGPPFVKFGAAVRYRRQDLEKWLSSQESGQR